MSEELLPCPFCGCAPKTIDRHDNIDGTQFFFGVMCYCGGYSACAHKMAIRETAGLAKAAAIEAWNRRAAAPSSAYQVSAAQQPPVAWAKDTGKKLRITTMPMGNDEGWRPLVYGDTIPLYTHPAQQAKPLTVEQIEADFKAWHYKHGNNTQGIKWVDDLLRACWKAAIEAAHGIKE